MINYRIYQVKFGEETKEFLFANMSRLNELGLKIDLNNYEVVYEGTIEAKYDNPFLILEELFYKFNVKHPENFKGRSMSVSDIVQLGNEYYYCDSFGFKKISLK